MLLIHPSRDCSLLPSVLRSLNNLGHHWWLHYLAPQSCTTRDMIFGWGGGVACFFLLSLLNCAHMLRAEGGAGIRHWPLRFTCLKISCEASRCRSTLFSDPGHLCAWPPGQCNQCRLILNKPVCVVGIYRFRDRNRKKKVYVQVGISRC